jgi:peptide/nickel transport system substrate-binding protein
VKGRRRTSFHHWCGRVLAVAAVAAASAMVPVLSSASQASASHSGGTLVFGMTSSELPGLDTVLSGNDGYEGFEVLGFQMYDGLTTFNLDQSTKTPTVQPDLATSWTSNANATVWTFQLRHGVKFQDGTPFNSAAVIFNLNRYIDTSFKYYSAALAGNLLDELDDVKSYTALGPYTVQFTTTQPVSYLPNNFVTLFMASPTAVEKYGDTGFNEHPVGTGPFEFVKEVPGQEIVLKSYKGYWAGPAKLNELVIKAIPNAESRVAALRSGEVNIINYPDPSQIPSLKAAGFKVDTNPYDQVFEWTFNDQVKPWNNLDARMAVEYAINRKAMANDLLDKTAIPSTQLFSPSNGAYRTSNNVFDYDPTKAKKLLKEAGYPHGFTTTVVYPSNGSGNMIPTPMMEELQSDLAKVGITINLMPLDPATLGSDMFGTGKYPGDSTAAVFTLDTVFEQEWPDYFGCSSPLNFGHWCNQQVDTLLAKAATQTVQAQREDTYAQIIKLVDQGAVWLPVVNDLDPRALAPDVHGFVEPKSWFFELRSVWVS